MTRFAEFNLFQADGHPPDDDLYLFVDGELPATNTAIVTKHLEVCWQCRVRVEKIQATISTFVEYCNHVQMAAATPPPHNWQGFGSQLAKLQHTAESPSTLERLRQLLTRVLMLDVPRPVILATVSFLLIGGSIAMLSWLDRTPTVAAKEVLQKATTAYTQQLRNSSEPVTYQQLSLRSKQQTQAVQWEVWHDPEHARWRHSLEATSKQKNSSPNRVPDTWRELENIYRVNQLDWQQPLSAAAYQAWREKTALASEEVAAAQREGQAVWILKAVVRGAATSGAIIESQFIIRQRDWHPIAHAMRVKGNESEHEYEINETKFEVVSLNVIGATFFAEAPLAKAVVTPVPTPTASLLVSPSPAVAATPTAAPAAVITLAELKQIEIEALRLLHQAGADLGEQIEVKRSADKIIISGIVEDQARQTQLSKQLAALSNRAVQIEIKTVAEAMAQEQQTTNSSAAIRMQFEGERAEPPAFPTLRQHFQKQGGADIEANINRTARQILTHSRAAMQRAYALRQLRPRLQAANDLPDEARTQLLSIAQSHARQLNEQLRGVEQSLQPFFAVQTTTDATSIAEGELVRAIDQLFAATAETDRMVRASFAASTGASSSIAVNSAEFRRALQQARQVALALLNYKIS